MSEKKGNPRAGPRSRYLFDAVRPKTPDESRHVTDVPRDMKCVSTVLLTHTRSWDHIVLVKTGTGSPLLRSKSSASHKALNLHPLNTYMDQALNLDGQSKSAVPPLSLKPPSTIPSVSAHNYWLSTFSMLKIYLFKLAYNVYFFCGLICFRINSGALWFLNVKCFWASVKVFTHKV